MYISIDKASFFSLSSATDCEYYEQNWLRHEQEHPEVSGWFSSPSYTYAGSFSIAVPVDHRIDHLQSCAGNWERARTKTNICPTVMRYIFRCKQRRCDSNSCRKRRVPRKHIRRKINVLANNRPVNKRMQCWCGKSRARWRAIVARAVEPIC